jgi:ribonucleoside-triphosphate reductase
MRLENEILSNLTIHMKYSRFLKEKGRRETWEELVDRNMQMHIKKFPKLKGKIEEVYKNFVLPKKVLPSMRSLQFGGQAIEVNPSRIYNCCALPINSLESFSETMFLLLGGTGVGFSVQKHHVEQLPEIKKPNPNKSYRYLIGDSIEGWADSVKILFKSYFGHRNSTVEFDFRDIRPKGTELVTSGGKAPGPQPLKECLLKIDGILSNKEENSKLTPIECHDIMCHIADAVLAGGIRRAAMISLFSFDDEEMLSAKSGSWWEFNSQRGRANNSAVILRHRIDKDEFNVFWEKVRNSGSGEPGFIYSNDKEWLTNPCSEIALRSFQFCNLVEINVSDVENQGELDDRACAASFLGTLQSSYTDFHYLREIWKRNTEKDALIGVSMTGIASGKVLKLDLKKAAELVKSTNQYYSKVIGINPAARTTCVKPAGSTSLVLGTSSGIHAWYNDYYIRRVRVNKSEAIYAYLSINHPEIISDDVMRPHDTAVIELPQKAPEGSILRKESAIDLLERVKKVSEDWISNGHISGSNKHNVSATISIKDNEWDIVRDWMWVNRDHYNGLSVLPYDTGTYQQTPFEDISKEKYEYLVKYLNQIELSNVIEDVDNTNLTGELACSGGSCEII